MSLINRPHLIGIIWFILSLVISILNDASMKLLSDNLHSMQIAFLRFTFSCLCLLPFMIYHHKRAFKTSRISIHIVRGAILFVAITLWCYGLSIVPIANATLMTFTIPLFILIMAPIFLNEKVKLPLIVATLIGFIGALISLNIFHVDFNSASILLLVSSLLFASLDIINKKFVMKESMLGMLFYSAMVTSILGAIPAYHVWNDVVFNDLMILLYLGIGSNLILYCLLKAFAYVAASSLAPYRYLELIFSAGMGFAIFSEVPGLMLLVGSLLIIPSTLYITFMKNDPQQS